MFCLGIDYAHGVNFQAEQVIPVKAVQLITFNILPSVTDVLTPTFMLSKRIVWTI